MIRISRGSFWLLVSIGLAFLLAVSLYGYYRFAKASPTSSRRIVDFQYTQRAEYACKAFVKPSLVYDNRTEISWQDGPLFTRLVERLLVTFQYRLEQKPVKMRDVKLKYRCTGILKGGDWQKVYTLSAWREMKDLTSFSDSFSLDVSKLQETVDAIGKETGQMVYQYEYLVQSQITLEGSVGGKQVKEEFTPKLTLRFGEGKIVVEGTRDTKSGQIAHQETVNKRWGMFGLTATYRTIRKGLVASSISIGVLLCLSVLLFIRERPRPTFLERLSKEVRAKIVEASDASDHIDVTTIRVLSPEDLVKISDETFKPIIHQGDQLYILDGEVKYAFHIPPENGEE